MKRPKRPLAWTALALYIGALLYLCFGHFDNVPGVSFSFLDIPTDKIVHFLMFFPFPLLAIWTYWKESTPRRSIAIVLIIGLLLAVGTELGQHFLTLHRDGDIMDFVADACAICLGTLTALLVVVHVFPSCRPGKD